MARGDTTQEKDTHMNKVVLGLAAVLLLGTAPVLAQDATAGAKVKAGADVGASADATTTGSVNAQANYGQLISGLRSNQDIDLSAFNAQSTVNCVAVSSLQGNNDAGASLEGAITAGEDRLAELRGDINTTTGLWTKIQASCADVADLGTPLTVDNILWIESGADGMFTVYVDDRAAAGGSMGTDAGAGASTSTSTGG
jgi:hypothetical protein